MSTPVYLNKSGHRYGAELIVIPIGRSAVNTEVDTGYDIPSTGIITDAFVNVKTAETTGTTKTLDIGLLSSESGGDADGFVDGLSVASAGFKVLTLVSTGQTKGAFLRVDENGSGVVVPNGFDCSSVTAKSVSRTLGSADWAEFEGELVLVYYPVPPFVS